VPKSEPKFATIGDVSEVMTPAPLPQAALDDAQRLACLRLIRSENIGPVTFRQLINLYGGATAALEALPDLSRRGGRGRPLKICPRDRAEQELQAARKIGAVPLFTIEPGYPPALAMIEQPPPMIYAKGDKSLLARMAVAIVGSRDASAAGQALTRLFAAKFGAAGIVVVSGLARGVDAVAHEASLATGTVAVLAGGIDNFYPPENVDLQKRISEHGCLVSEMPPGFSPRGQDFPRRNRIISGISRGVVVMEAARRSGTLITARIAAEQGREVFAVPGNPLDPRAEGTNDLIKKGATFVTSPEDVLEILAPQLRGGFEPFMPPRPGHVEDKLVASPQLASVPYNADDVGNSDRVAILSALGPAPVHLDDVVRTTGLPARVVMVAVLELGLAGRIERHGGQMVSLLPAVG
jgi:DNA processing protein